ncbi:MAG: RpiB/LacA/LacB family sugar-phosphate isomerase [Anaerolineae bacterium]|jgi:ribose 5-phosphate isomerase RpiB|nr:RpiB/LacA/LacB family sugar-phosphate isomerase [Anaerolineae bacterium]
MKIAVINEISAADRNADILRALEGRGHEILNLGNTGGNDSPALLYTHTGLMSALLLHLHAVDFVVGGCGTGIGYLNSVMQYPGVFCAHLLTPLDAFLFARINAGNCISLALNQGYGWAGDVNLRLIFDALFTPETGTGYPPHRAEPQRQGRETLAQISCATHRPMAKILPALPAGMSHVALSYPRFRPLLEDAIEAVSDPALSTAIKSALKTLP